MDQNTTKISAKDFFLNLGATIALYTSVFSLLYLLFTVINTKYPKIANGYYSSSSISWSVAVLIIFVPLLLVLMWVINKNYEVEPQRRNAGVHKWLTYLTIFVSGLVLAGDLVTVIYYFIDGQELTTAFLLKVLALVVVSGSVFMYFLSEVRNKLTPQHRNMWRVFAVVLVLGSIIWGFSVLGSPRTQRLAKYDEQKVNDLLNLESNIGSFYATNGILPYSLSELKSYYYYVNITDTQTKTDYEYKVLGGLKYELCATFNKSSIDENTNKPIGYYGNEWNHPEGRHCFERNVNTNLYPKPAQIVR